SNNITALWSEVRVYGPDGIKLCENNGPNMTEIASCTLPSTGSYAVLAYDSYGTGNGDYAVHLQRLNNLGNSQPIAFGQTISASIISMAEMDAYTFTASAGDKVLVRMSNNITALWSEVRVYGPDGIKLCENNGPNMTEIASCTLPSTGSYAVLAYDSYGTGNGDYAVHLQRLNNPGNSQPIAFGQTISAAIISMAEMDAYTFTASAGDKVWVRMSNSVTSFWSEVRVYSPDGVKLCENNSPDTAEIASCTLPANGVYKILAFDSYGTGAGNYTIAIFHITTSAYHGWMLQSIGAYDGWTLESAENSNVGGSMNSTATIFRLGDDAAKRQYRAILSFNTAVLPDGLSNAKIKSVVLKIRRQGTTGTNPFTTHNGLRVDIRKPFFGTGLNLANSDFQAFGANLVGIFGATPINNWYTATLNATAYPQINRTGTTQFRLRFSLDDDNDAVADFIKFYSGNAGEAFRPILIIKYAP
ncbi:MAG: pre-peptidase C-terminal domain-containing protein, partial [Chloroflexota bacterium]